MSQIAAFPPLLASLVFKSEKHHVLPQIETQTIWHGLMTALQSITGKYWGLQGNPCMKTGTL